MRYFFTTCQVLGNGPSLEIAGFCIHISDFSVLSIHILIQLTKKCVVTVTRYFLK